MELKPSEAQGKWVWLVPKGRGVMDCTNPTLNPPLTWCLSAACNVTTKYFLPQKNRVLSQVSKNALSSISLLNSLVYFLKVL